MLTCLQSVFVRSSVREKNSSNSLTNIHFLVNECWPTRLRKTSLKAFSIPADGERLFLLIDGDQRFFRTGRNCLDRRLRAANNTLSLTQRRTCCRTSPHASLPKPACDHQRPLGKPIDPVSRKIEISIVEKRTLARIEASRRCPPLGAGDNP